MKLSTTLLLSVLTAGCGTVQPAPAGLPSSSSHAGPHAGDEGPSGAPREALAWAELGPAAFAKARAEGRLVVVDGAAEWCHWCHVMEATTYHDPEVRKVLEAGYVPVKVDVDSRPDFEERYEAYGWPATVILTADGKELGKFKGYLEPGRFAEILRAASLQARAGGAKDDDATAPPVRALTAAELDAARIRAEAQLDQYWDPQQAGWGTRQKAPLVWEDAWALSRARQGDATQRERVLLTLDRQQAIIDPVWGGVCQYSTDGDWKHPHHEKLMTVQAGAIANYAEAYALTRDPRWLRTAQLVRGFVDRFLTGDDGAWLTTMDADLNAHEPAGSGKPYVTGNAYYAMDDAAPRALGIPRVDAHAYGRENGLALDAYVTLYEASGDGSALEAAKKAAARVLSTHGTEGGGVTHGPRPDDPAKVLYLADNAALGFGLAHLYAATRDEATLAAAKRIADFLLRDLYDARGGGFYGSTPDPDAVGVFAVRRKPPEDDVMAARFLARLRQARARRALRATPSPRRSPLSAAPRSRSRAAASSATCCSRSTRAAEAPAQDAGAPADCDFGFEARAAYSCSSTGPKTSTTLRRLSLRLGVSMPLSVVKSSFSRAKSWMDSKPLNGAPYFSISLRMSDFTRSSLRSASGSPGSVICWSAAHFCDRGHVRDDERDVVGLVVAEDHDVEDERAELELLLERRGHDVLAVLELVLLLDAARDEHEAVGIDEAHVARAEAAVLREHGGVLLGALEVALHHVVAVHDQLALEARGLRAVGGAALAGGGVDLDPHAGDGAAHAADLAGAGDVGGGDGARLGQAVALVDHDAERVDELGHVARQRRAARERVAQLARRSGPAPSRRPACRRARGPPARAA